MFNYLFNRKAESYVDTAGKILIAVTLAAILLVGLSNLWNTTILPGAANEVEDMFNSVNAVNPGNYGG